MPSSVPSGGLAVDDRASLTSAYLDEVARQGQTAGDLLAVMPKAGVLATRYEGRHLSRPLFLGHAEADQVNSDLRHARAAIADLPQLLYDGDLAAFGRTVGLADVQIEAVLRARAGRLTEWVRADMHLGAQGLQLLEFNMGSPAGGMDTSEILRAMLRYPLLRNFAREHRLNYPDTAHEQVRMLFADSGFEPDSYPMVALVDWPDHFEKLGDYLHKIARRWRDSGGVDAHACHIGQLKVRDGRVWLRGRPVDIVFRMFMIEHLLEPGGPDLMFPIIDAAARDEVAMFSPVETDMYASKATLAMLSDDANRNLFTPAQLAAFDRVLPWTRMVRPGPVTLEDGSTADLMAHALGRRAELVLKPGLMHGGIGVVAGWDPDITGQAWRDALNGAMGGPHVLQRRVEVIPEMCPGEDGELTAWEPTWGVFPTEAGFGGVWARSHLAQTGYAITRQGKHLRMTGCLIQQPGPQAQA
jgi:hypothetical protein